MEGFNQLLKSKLSKRIAKKDFPDVLETLKDVLKKEINETKNFESIFEEETWNVLSSCIEEHDSKVVLELLQLYTVIVPKGKEYF